MQLGYFQVIALPVSTWVQLTFDRSPEQSARLVTKLKIPPRPSLSPGYQFWTVEYFTSESSCAKISTTAACSWFSSRIGAVHGMLSEGFTLVRAHGVRKIGEGGGDENEDIVVHLVPRDAIPKFIEQKRAEGLGVDAKLLLLLNF